MDYRVEQKFLVTDADLALLRARLGPVMGQDVHQDGDCYEIRSVYFDDLRDSCLEENESGVDERRKYRIRTYGAEGGLIRLEIKEKRRGLTHKDSCALGREEAEEALTGRLPFAPDGRSVLNLLKVNARAAGLRPKAVIVYERTAFVYPAGNVRITFDRNIMASRQVDGFFDRHVPGLVPVLPAGMHVLEVKYDELLPDFIARQLEIGSLRQTAFSKYYLGRLAVQGEFPIDR